MLDYLEESYEAGEFSKVASVFTAEAVLTVGHGTYAGKDEIKSFWSDLFVSSPNMSYAINQTDTEEAILFGIFDMENGAVFEFEIEYDPDTNRIIDAIFNPSN